jgi:hypothetical protein
VERRGTEIKIKG